MKSKTVGLALLARGNWRSAARISARRRGSGWGMLTLLLPLSPHALRHDPQPAARNGWRIPTNQLFPTNFSLQRMALTRDQYQYWYVRGEVASLL